MTLNAQRGPFTASAHLIASHGKADNTQSVAAPPSEVLHELTELRHRVHHASGQLEILMERLRPVLDDTPSATAGAGEPAVSQVTPLGRELRIVSNDVDSINDRLSTLLNLLQL